MNAPIRDIEEHAVNARGYGSREPELVEFDFLGLVRTLRRRFKVILGITIGLTALVLVALFQMTPLYTAESLVLIDSQHRQVINFEDVMAGLPADSSTIDSQVEVMRSRSIARRVIEKLDLLGDEEFNGSLAKPSIFSWIDPRVWIRSLISSEPTKTSELRDEQIMDSAIDAVLAREKITRKGVTYIIALDFTSKDPVKAARIANALAETYILDQLEAKFDATKQANEWLSQRLDGLKQQVADSERAAEIFRAENGLQSTQGNTINDQQLSELNAQLILARADSAEKQAKYLRAKQILSNGGSVDSVGDVLASKTISDLRSQQSLLANQEADLSTKYGPRHPAILNIEAQRRGISRQISDEVRRIVESIQNDAIVADTRVKALDKSLNDLQNTAGQNGQAQIHLRELEREAAANKSVYESFLNRYKETSQQQDLQTADSRVISHATPPLGPSFPKKPLLGMVALVLSMVTGVGVALLLERLDNGLRTGTQIEESLGLPHLVSVPIVPGERGPDGKGILPHDYLLKKPLSGYAESMRSLRSALSLSNVDNPPKVILFTSALPNEGKTTTAVSFARAAAHSGLRVVLIDCDLRHPSVHRTMGGPRPELGLVELLAGPFSFDKVLIKDPASGLEYIPVASGAANPPDLLGSEQMRRVLDRCRQNYDLVVLDTAPVLPVSDSRVLAQLADKTVFVVRWDQTPREAAASGVKELRSFNANLAGVAMTLVDTAKQAKYGYGDSGYYYGRYSRYYSD